MFPGHTEPLVIVALSPETHGSLWSLCISWESVSSHWSWSSPSYGLHTVYFIMKIFPSFLITPIGRISRDVCTVRRHRTGCRHSWSKRPSMRVSNFKQLLWEERTGPVHSLLQRKSYQCRIPADLEAQTINSYQVALVGSHLSIIFHLNQPSFFFLVFSTPSDILINHKNVPTCLIFSRLHNSIFFSVSSYTFFEFYKQCFQRDFFGAWVNKTEHGTLSSSMPLFYWKYTLELLGFDISRCFHWL